MNLSGTAAVLIAISGAAMARAPVHLTTVDARDWGVAANASATANTVALQAALNYAISSGVNDLTLPPFRFSINREVVGAPTHPFRIHGLGGPGASSIRLLSLTQNGLVIDSQSPVTFENFSIVTSGENNGSTVPSAGNCISLSATRGYNAYSIFRDLDLNGCFFGIHTGAASGWVMQAVFIHSVVKAGIGVANSNNADIGDSSISDSFIDFNPLVADPYGIIQYSAGGLKISDTKILNTGSSGVGTCYTLYPDHGAVTSDLQISNLSCENVQRGLLFQYYAATSKILFQNVNVTNSHFNYVKWPISEVDGGTGAAWLSTVVVVGGNMLVTDGGTGFAFNNVPYVSIAGSEVICVPGRPCTGLSAGRNTTGSAIIANYATTPFLVTGPGFTAINTVGGGLSINQGGKVGVTCSGPPSGSFASTNGVVTHC